MNKKLRGQIFWDGVLNVCTVNILPAVDRDVKYKYVAT